MGASLGEMLSVVAVVVATLALNTLSLILLVAVLCSARSHLMHRLQTHAGAVTQKYKVHVFRSLFFHCT